MAEGKELAKTKKTSLLAKMATKASLDPQVFYDTITKTVFKDAKTKEQVVALLMVADQYGLNPVTKEIFAFPDKGGGVVPVVGVDGWNRIAQQHPMFDGIDYNWAETDIVPDGGKRCPLWCEAVVYRKDRSHPVIVREYLDECYRKTGPWQSHTKRMLRHKATIQGYRAAFGFHGIYDQDEAESMVIETPTAEEVAEASTNAQKAREALGAAPPPSEPSNDAREAPAPPDEALNVDEETGEVLEGEIEEPAEELPLEPPPKKATKRQVEAVLAAKEKGGWDDDLYGRMLDEYGVKKAADLTGEQAHELIRYLLSGADPETDDGD